MLRFWKYSQLLKRLFTYIYQTYVRQWDGAVRIDRLRYGLVVPGFEPDTGKKIFYSRKSRSALAQTQSLSQRVPEFFFQAEKSGCGVDQSHHSSVEVMKEWSHTSTPRYVFMKWTGTTVLYLRQ
jgi:hypothetical protein